MMKEIKLLSTTATIAGVLLAIGLAESVLLYLKLGDILFTDKGLIIRFVVVIYFGYWISAVCLFILSKICFFVLRRFKIFGESDISLSIISITIALIFSAQLFLFSFDNIVQNPLAKKGVAVLLALLVIGIALCFLFRFLIGILARHVAVSKLLSLLGTERFQIGIAGLYIVTGAYMILFAGAPKAEANMARPNIWLISIDTLRQDRLSCYGYKHNQTPHIDKLASDGILFENAFSTHYWTLPAHASLFTSLNPSVHGTTNFFDKISEDLEMFTEVLSENGYRCFGAVDLEPLNYLGAKRNFDQGYEYYSHYPITMSAEDYLLAIRFFNKIMVPFEKEHSSSIISSIIRWLPKKDSSPYFFFLHLYDVHADHNIFSHFWGYPYYPFKPFADHLITNKELLRDSSMIWKGNSVYLNQINEMSINWKDYEGPPQEQIQFFSELYDCGVSWVDYHLGRLFDHMREIDVYDNSLIIVISDHGESFYEHRRMNHFEHYEACIRIPFIIKPAGNRSGGERILTPISLIDIGPTLLDLLELRSLHVAEGKSMADIVSGQYEDEGDDNDLHRVFFSGSIEEFLSLRKGALKLLRLPERNPHEKNYRIELYNTDKDRNEKIELSVRKPNVVSEYDGLVEKQFDSFQNLRFSILGEKPTESIEATGRVIEELRGLGYLK